MGLDSAVAILQTKGNHHEASNSIAFSMSETSRNYRCESSPRQAVPGTLSPPTLGKRWVAPCGFQSTSQTFPMKYSFVFIFNSSRECIEVKHKETNKHTILKLDMLWWQVISSRNMHLIFFNQINISFTIKSLNIIHVKKCKRYFAYLGKFLGTNMKI